VVVAAVQDAGSEKEAAHRLGLSHSPVKHHLAPARSQEGAATPAQPVWTLAPRLPEPEDVVIADGAQSHVGSEAREAPPETSPIGRRDERPPGGLEGPS
jgi:hypothetical protein